MNKGPGKDHAFRGLFFGLVVLGLTAGCAGQPPSSAPGGPGATPSDTRPLYQMLLEWAVLDNPLPAQTGELHFPDRQLLLDRQAIRLSTENLPKGLALSLPGKALERLDPRQLQDLAEKDGSLPALQFGELKTVEGDTELGVDLVWFVPRASAQVPLSGGGVRLRFQWLEGGWRLAKGPVEFRIS